LTVPWERTFSPVALTLAPHCGGTSVGCPERGRRDELAAEQGKDTPAGRLQGLNIEQVYTTTVPAEEFGRARVDAYRPA